MFHALFLPSHSHTRVAVSFCLCVCSFSFPFSEPKRSFDIWGELLTPDELRVITGASVSGGGGGSNSNSTNARGHSYSRLLKQEKDIKQQIQHNLQQHQQQLQQQQQNNANMGDDHAVQEEEPQKTIKEQVTVRIYRRQQDRMMIRLNFSIVNDINISSFSVVDFSVPVSSRLLSSVS